MTSRVFLHVGSPKTGTTFLQEVLWSNRERAREQGLLLPLESFHDHFLASLDVRGLAGLPQHPARAVGLWDRLAAEATAWTGTVLVSHELFAAASAEQAERAIAALGDAETHVVVTARDLVRQIPAEWQEHVKHRSTQGFSAFVDDLMQDREGRTWFWRVQDVPEVLRRWGGSLPPSRVHVVVVPPGGAESATLWERFAGLVGVDGAAFDLELSRSNTSLRAEQAELLRRVNAELGDRLPVPGPYPETVKNVFAHRVLANRAGTSFALTGASREFAVLRSKEMASALADLDVHVVGDLAELVPPEVPDQGTAADSGGPIDPGEVTDGALLSEGLAALADLLVRLNIQRKTAAELRVERDHLREERDRLVAEMTHRPARHLLKGLSQRWAWAMRARERYRRGAAAFRVLSRKLAGKDRERLG